jgi:hypothetical protein
MLSGRRRENYIKMEVKGVKMAFGAPINLAEVGLVLISLQMIRRFHFPKYGWIPGVSEQMQAYQRNIFQGLRY